MVNWRKVEREEELSEEKEKKDLWLYGYCDKKVSGWRQSIVHGDDKDDDDTEDDKGWGWNDMKWHEMK